MKKFSVCLALFAVLLFVVSCDDGSKNEEPDTGETVTDTDTADDSEPADDSDSNSDSDTSDTGIQGSDDDSDSTPSQPDDGDSIDDDGDSLPDNGDTTDDSEKTRTPCNPNPCVDIATSDGKCIEKENTFECGCLENYSWKNYTCVANTRYEACTLPDHAELNTAEGITQQWTGSTWEPSVESVYNEQASSTQCRFKCIFNQDEQYEWDGTNCVIHFPQCTAENDGKTCKDYDTGYIWSVKSTNDYTFKNAKSYCENLDTDGLSWRLPTIDEFRTAIRHCPQTEKGGTCRVSVERWQDETYLEEEKCGIGCELNETEGNSIFGDQNKGFWSSTVSNTEHSYAYVVGFWNDGYGQIQSVSQKSSMRVRCLSAGCKTLSNGLTWSPISPSLRWDNIEDYCNNLNECGYSDWRVPNISELRTLIKNCYGTQTGGSCAVSDPDHLFDNDRSTNCTCSSITPHIGYYSKLGDNVRLWSSSLQTDHPEYAWFVDFKYANVTAAGFGSGEVHVRCVR